MHPYYFSQRYREQLAGFEHRAAIRRQFPKQPNGRFKRFASALIRSRRTAPTVTSVAAEARPCH